MFAREGDECKGEVEGRIECLERKGRKRGGEEGQAWFVYELLHR